jgi:hypothetical protein
MDYTLPTTAGELTEGQEFVYADTLYAVTTIDEDTGIVVGIDAEDGLDTIDLEPEDEVLIAL